MTDPSHPLLSIHKLLHWQLRTENNFKFLHVTPESFLIRTRIKIQGCYGTTRPTNFETKQLERQAFLKTNKAQNIVLIKSGSFSVSH